MQSIKEMLEKIKPLYTLLLYIALASLFFALGRLSVIEEQKRPVRIETSTSTGQGNYSEQANTATKTGLQALKASETEVNPTDQGAMVFGTTDQSVVASKKGTKYYFPWCGGAKSIKPENKVTFASRTEAEAKGYTKAANCKGL